MSTSSPRAKDLMSSPPLFLQRDATLLDAARFLLEHRLSGAPVLDDRGRPAGVFTLRDLAKFFLDPWLGAVSGSPPAPSVDPTRVRISEYMTPRFISVLPDATVEEMRRSMRGHQVHRLLVEDAKAQVIGVVSASDLALRASE